MILKRHTAQMHLNTGRREVGLVLATRLGVMGIMLLGQGVLAHTLLAEGRGMYAVCVLFGTLCGALFTPGSDRGAQYFVMSRQLSLSQGMSAAFGICVAGSLVGVAAMLPLVHSDLRFFDNAEESSFYLAFLLIPAVTMSVATLRQIAGLRRFVQMAVFSLIQAVAFLSTTVILVWELGFGVNGAIASLIVGHAVSTVIGIIDLRRHCGLSFSIPSPDSLLRVLRYGLRDYVSTVGQAASGVVAALMLGLLAGPAEIGLVALSSAIVTRVLVVPYSVSTFLAPRVAEDPSRGADLSAYCTRMSVWIVGCALIAWVATSGPTVALLLPGEFAPVVHLTWIMSIGVCAASASEVLTSYFGASDLPQVASRSVWVGLSASVALIFALYPAMGIEGAAWALTGGNICRGAVLLSVFCRRTGKSLCSVLTPRQSDVLYLWNSENHPMRTRR